MSRSSASSAGLSSKVCRSSITSSARGPSQVSRARAAVSTDSHRSGIRPSAAANADSRWLSRVLVLASQLSARYQATGTLAEAAKVASSVLLPEQDGATTSPTRCCQIRASSASTRSRARDWACGISTLAETTAPDPSLTLVSPRPLGLIHTKRRHSAACADPSNVPAYYLASPPQSLSTATVHSDSLLSRLL